MAASLIVLWEDYGLEATWRDFTGGGMFTTHDPARGRTLYGAEVMVHPALQGQGIGKQLYDGAPCARPRLGLLRIRAGARLRDYPPPRGATHPRGRTSSPSSGARWATGRSSFQLSQGFRVIGVVAGYLAHDPDSLGHAAVIEWVNEVVAARPGTRRRPGLPTVGPRGPG